MSHKSVGLTAFVRLDPYETQAVRKLQTMIEKHSGRRLHTDQLLRGALRYFVKETLPEDFILGDNLRDVMGENLLQAIWQRTASSIEEHTPEDPPASS